MNSTEEVKQNGILRDDINQESPSTSQPTNSDNNANVNSTTIDESKGAIPKTKIVKKTNIKVNNNVEDNNLTSVLKRINVVSNNYLNNSVESDNNSEQFNNSSNDMCCSSNNLDFRLNYDDDYYSKPYVPLVTNHTNKYYEPNIGLNAFQSSLQLQINKKDSSDSSSSDDNDLLSVSDDGCIYTYKGDNIADLPISFFNLELPPTDNNDQGNGIGGDNREELSSPEMDFLEMDFDPSPSGDADSDSSSNPEIENPENLPLDSTPQVTVVPEEPKPGCSKYLDEGPVNKINETPKTNNVRKINETISEISPPQEPVIDVKLPWSCKVSERTRRKSPKRQRSRITFMTDEKLNDSLQKGKTVIGDSIEKVMVWSEQEAISKQITQIGTSLCGATAILNVLSAFNYPLPSNENVQEFITTKLRANSNPLTEYLQSCSVAGCTHRDLISGLYKASQGRIYSRFFAMYPERIVNLHKWLGYWIKNGAVPIACLNLQKCDNTNDIADSWHHQMIYGVGPKGVYLTNPLECLDGSDLWPQLSSESVLLIRTQDVLSRLNPEADFPELMKITDTRWKELNVLGQIARILRESRKVPRPGSTVSTHIKIPADYKAGIILAIGMDAPAFNLLHQCPELPLLEPKSIASAL